MSTAPTVNCPLDGINLIEAAAGTGKTYNIQNLVVRYILETDCTIDQLAVVSYTVPAAAELKDRLRKVLQAVKSEIECSDSTQSQQAKDLLSRSRSCGISPKIAAAKINRALEDFDLAQVCTIHGFCQKILADCALDCGESFSARLDNDKKALLSPIIDDCRRRYLYGDDGWILQALLKHFKINLDELLDMDNSGREIFYPAPDDPVPELEQSLDSLKVSIEKILNLCQKDPLRPLYNKFSGRSTYKNDNLDLDTEIFAQIDSPRMLFLRLGTVLKYLPKKIAEKSSTAAQCARQELFFLNLEDFYRFAKNCVYALFIRCRNEVRTNFNMLKAQKNVMTFDDLLTKTRDALRKSSHLREELSRRLRAGIIDEFQDTDPVQLEIFRTIFDGKNAALFMVGDPRQAIYQFRGGDISTYVRAASEVPEARRYTLSVNYRSTPKLIDSVNRIFLDHPAAFATMDFHMPQVSAPLKRKDKKLRLRYSSRNDPMPLRLIQLADSEDPKSAVSGRIKTILAQKIDIRKWKDGKVKTRPLTAGDIAILCDNWKNAKAVQYELGSIPSVILKSGNIFYTREAGEMLDFLRGVFNFRDESILNLALLGPIVDAKPETIQSRKAEYLQLFQELNDLWLNHSFGEMFARALKIFRVPQKYAGLPDGEQRLSDLLQLSDILQNESFSSNVPALELLRFLNQKINDANSDNGDNLQISAAGNDAVKILTIHSSKGLEFPVVMIPYLGNLTATASGHQKPLPVSDKKLGLYYDIFRGGAFKDALGLSVMQEKLRLAYVALTRASYHCEIFVPPKTKYTDTPLDWLFRVNQNTPLPESNYWHYIKSLKDDGDITYPASFILKHEPDTEHRKCRKENKVNLQERSWQDSKLDRKWKFTSFSALTGKQLLTSALPEELAVPENDESDPDDAAIAIEQPTLSGAAFGTAVHDILEHLDFTGSIEDIRLQVTTRLEHLSPSPNDIDLCTQKISDLLNLPLNCGITLSEITGDNKCCEMRFQYHFRSGFSRTRVMEIAGKCLDSETVLFDSESDFSGGSLTGAIDLIFQHQGKYFIADWKTNRLDAYDQKHLHEAMAHHSYQLQLLIYTLAFTKFLRLHHGTMSRELYDEKFGGVYYFFLRGIVPNQPEQGVFFLRPDYDLIMQLDEVIG